MNIAELSDQIETLRQKVYELKQIVGLGIEVEKVLSMKKKWERAARIG